MSDGEWIEITNRRVPGLAGAPSGTVEWEPINGSEQIILGEVSVLTDCAPVQVATEPAPTEVRSGAH